jgi:hypothetical protein
VAGAVIAAVGVIGILAFLMFPAFFVFMVHRRQAPRPQWRYRTTRNKALVGLLAGFSLVIPMLVMVLVVSIHWSAARASLASGHFFSVTGRLANVRFEKSAVGRGPVPRIIEHDVFTLKEGNSFEIDCSYNSNESPRTERPYACLNAQIGDDLTVASTVSLGIRGAVPALRIWRNDNS